MTRKEKGNNENVGKAIINILIHDAISWIPEQDYLQIDISHIDTLPPKEFGC